MRKLILVGAIIAPLAVIACNDTPRTSVSQTTVTAAEMHPDVDTSVDLRPPVAPVILIGRAPREPGAGERLGMPATRTVESPAR